jgi:IS605 OrfB family transposase
VDERDGGPQDANHVVSKRIVEQHPHSLIGLEHLTDIRERTKRRKGKKASKKQRKANAAYSKWSFAELQGMIAYKALLHSSMAIKVDANYTSQACPICGHTCEANRPGKGLLFICQNCHYTLHADLIGARNVTMRTLLVRQDWARTGLLEVGPRCVGQRSQSRAPSSVLGVAVESRHKPRAAEVGVTDS